MLAVPAQPRTNARTHAHALAEGERGGRSLIRCRPNEDTFCSGPTRLRSDRMVMNNIITLVGFPRACLRILRPLQPLQHSARLRLVVHRPVHDSEVASLASPPVDLHSIRFAAGTRRGSKHNDQLPIEHLVESARIRRAEGQARSGGSDELQPAHRKGATQRTEKELHTYEDHVEKCVCTWHRAAFL